MTESKNVSDRIEKPSSLVPEEHAKQVTPSLKDLHDMETRLNERLDKRLNAVNKKISAIYTIVVNTQDDRIMKDES